MRNEARKTGVSLTELLIVLAITVVLAAILTPALATPDQRGTSEGRLMDSYIVAEDESAFSRTRFERDHEAMESLPQAEQPHEESGVLKLIPAIDDMTKPETLQRDGLKQFKTTDISYQLP